MSKTDMDKQTHKFLLLGKVWDLLKPLITLEEKSILQKSYDSASKSLGAYALELYDYAELLQFKVDIMKLASKYKILDKADPIIERYDNVDIED